MLRIIRGGFYGAGRARLKSMISDLVERGERTYLIVPEQQTVMAEAEMTRELSDSAPMYFEATNFTRLANTTFRTLGGVSGEYCTKTKKALIMWRTLTELCPVLNMTEGRREISVGLVERAMSAVTDMQVLGIGTDELAEYTSHASLTDDKRLLGKLTDLSSIYSLYHTLVHEKYADTADDIDMMAQKLVENPDFLSDAHFFIEGFTSFTEPQYKLLAILMTRCDVSIYLTIPSSAEDSFEYTELCDTLDKLKSISRRSDVRLKIIKEDAFTYGKCEALHELSGSLFRNITNNDNISLQNPEELRIFEAQTPFDMCDAVASDIRRRVMEGAHFSDFAIVARDATSYIGILDAALSRAEIPAFISKKSDAASFEAIKLIYTAYAAVRSGFAREDVISYAKCGLCGISRQMCDELEMYVDVWQISGRRFTDGLVWNMNPRGYSTSRSDTDSDKLVRINATRESVITPLVAFSENVKRASTVRAHAEALLDFLREINLESSLISRAEMLASLGEREYAEDNSKLWALICSSLDTLVEVSGDMPSDADSFLGQLKILFSSAKMGNIPAHVDEVTVGSADMLRLHGKKHIYLIGVNQGEFPMAPTDSSYFSERDKITLSSLGLGIKPEIETRSSKELYFFSRAFSYATDSVTIYYCARDNTFKAIQRADVIDRILRLTDGLRVLRVSDLSVRERVWSASAAIEDNGTRSDSETSAIRAALVRAGHADTVEISQRDITNSSLSLGKDICERNRGTLAVSQSRLDTFAGCPLSYFCKYTIKLSEQSRAEFNAANIGSFIHSILENFFKTLREQGKDAATLSEDDKLELTKKSAEKYIGSLANELSLSPAGVRVKVDRLCRAAKPIVDGLCDEFSRSKFVPTFFELSLSAEDGPGAVVIDSEQGPIKIFGIVDRVDTYHGSDGVYIRVVDYKTGSKEFSPEDMEEGKNLQMFLYLDALINSKNPRFLEKLGVDEGQLHPAGVLYLKSSLSDVKVDTPDDASAQAALADAQKREGMVLDSEEIIDAMGIQYTPLYSKKNPDAIPSSKRNLMYDSEGWNKIIDTVHSSVVRIADGIRSGDACATPTLKDGSVGACEWCEYKPICRMAIVKK